MDIEKQLRQFIIENFLLGDEGGLTNAQSLLRTGVIDSTGVLELVTFIEETYQLEIADTEMLPENLDSIDNIGRFLARKLAGRATPAADKAEVA
ncbi:MAG TPA: acyl carrier protein [Phycisphaerae bacterium]|nr:acyl carrier protein [Phycisphaerae bacterium]